MRPPMGPLFLSLLSNSISPLNAGFARHGSSWICALRARRVQCFSPGAFPPFDSSSSSTRGRDASPYPTSDGRSIASSGGGALAMASPKRGSAVERYRTVSVNCGKCGTRLFRYKKKNGTKSNLVKCYVERISEDSSGVLAARGGHAAGDAENGSAADDDWRCPNCDARFARSALIHGRAALKLVGGKVRMTKK